MWWLSAWLPCLQSLTDCLCFTSSVVTVHQLLVDDDIIISFHYRHSLCSFNSIFFSLQFVINRNEVSLCLPIVGIACLVHFCRVCCSLFELVTEAHMLSVLWRCWLGGRKGIRPVKTKWWGAGMVICLEQGADLHMVQLMPLSLIVSCFSKIQIGFTFLVLAHPGSPGQRAVKRVVCACCLNTWSPKWDSRH